MLEETEVVSRIPKAPPSPVQQSKRGGSKEVFAIALPMVISLSFDSLMTFIDRLFLSRLGSAHMSASLAGGLASFVIATFFYGLIGYATAMVAQRIGQGRPQDSSRVLTHAILLSIVAFPIILLLRPLAHQLFILSGIVPEQLAPQIQYFDILVYGSLIGMLRHTFSSFFSGIGETRIVMIASLVALVVNSLLNYALIFGHWGMPALGIQGAAIGTISATAASLLVLVFRYFAPSIRSHFHSALSWKISWSIIKEYLAKGTPSGTEMLLNLLAFQVMILIFHGRGLANATAATILFNWDMVTFIPLLGLEVAATSLVGRYAGAKDYAAAERTTRSAIKIGWLFSGGITIAFLLIPQILVNVFRPDPVDAAFLEAFPTAVSMIRIAAIYVMIESIMVVYAGALRGAGDTLWAMIILVSLHWITATMLWLSYHVFHWRVITSWVVLVFGFLLFPVFLWLRWRTGKWRNCIPQAE